MRARGSVATLALLGLAAVIALAALPSTGLATQESGAVAQRPETGAVRAQEPEPAAAGQEHAAGQEERAAGQEEHGEAEAEHGAPSWTDYAFKWVNFALLVVLLWWLLVVPPPFVIDNFDFPGLKVILTQRSREIVESRDLAHEQLETAKTTIAESEARLQRVEDEAAALIDEAEADARREHERVVATAEQEAQRIREHASRDMGAEVVRARRQLQRHVADLSVGMASDMVKNSLSPEDQERLVREYLDRLGQTVA